ncbi:MAG: biotin/lipoyl-binding protein [Bacillota bacterium]|jgi:glutaconyl-CoA decarboxylase|nr:biotin/lipoyl-binding protein [Bacillota bacterium]
MRYEVIVNGVSYLVEVKALEQQESKPGFIPLASSAPSTPAPSPAPPLSPKPEPQGGANTVESPMPGKIISVAVKEGEAVEKDQLLLILEAMKMENEIRSPSGGVVGEILVSAGDHVESGEALINLR